LEPVHEALARYFRERRQEQFNRNRNFNAGAGAMDVDPDDPLFGDVEMVVERRRTYQHVEL
jgi:hypothetical protein